MNWTVVVNERDSGSNTDGEMETKGGSRKLAVDPKTQDNGSNTGPTTVTEDEKK